MDYKEYHKQYYQQHKEHMQTQHKARLAALSDEVRQERKVRYGLKQKERYRQQRIDTINRYGGKCTCCGETQMKFLSFDHINGGGTKQREETKERRVVNWLIKNGYPEGFQVHCHNCNMAKGFYGICPHQEAK